MRFFEIDLPKNENFHYLTSICSNPHRDSHYKSLDSAISSDITGDVGYVILDIRDKTLLWKSFYPLTPWEKELSGKGIADWVHLCIFDDALQKASFEYVLHQSRTHFRTEQLKRLGFTNNKRYTRDRYMEILSKYNA